MFAELGEALSGFVELVASVVNGTLSSRRALPRPDDLVRTRRALTVRAEVLPLNSDSPRFEWTVPLGTRLRVEVAPHASARPAYLVTVDPLSLESLPPAYRDGAALGGLGFEISSALLRTHFA